MIPKDLLVRKYVKAGQSVRDIALRLGCSENKVTYWLQKHNINKRSLSEALYIKHNPSGDPFVLKKPVSSESWFLYGLGLGLYWGEGNKANKHSVRLGNTDPDLILKFLEFLETVYDIDKKRLRFGLQIFTDIDKNKALHYWANKLNVDVNKFQKVVVTKSVRKGTYRKKSEYGVLTIYFSNTKLRDTIVSAIEELRTK